MSLDRRSERADRILLALKADATKGRTTEFFAREGRCSVGEAVVELQRLEREHDGQIRRSRCHAGMTWMWVR